MREAGRLEILKISDILPNRFQPRIKFDDESLNQLAISIARFGVIEPIVVRPTGEKYEIIAGERRFKASKLAGRSTIPCMIVNLSDKDSEELALLENVQRKALSPIEEAVSYKKILDSGYISREELSKKIGKPQSLIFSKIKLLDLADEVQNYLLNNKISERHARSLLQLSSLSDQVAMLHRIVDERLTVKATDREIDKVLRSKGKLKIDDDAETLFDDERGKEKMDIDKIMQEAKDINVEEAPKAQGPNLMEAGKDIPSEPLGGLPELPVNEPGKFVSVKTETNPSDVGVPVAPNGVTFNNMFAEPVVNSEVSSSAPFQPNLSGNDADSSNVGNSGFDSNTLMAGVTPLVQPSLSPTPDLTVPMNEGNASDVGVSAQALTGVTPDSFNSVLHSNILSSEPVISQPMSSPVDGPIAGSQPSVEPLPDVTTHFEQPVIPSVGTSANDLNSLNQYPQMPDMNQGSIDVNNFSQPVNPMVSSDLNNTAFNPQQMDTIPEVTISKMDLPVVSDNVIPNPVHVDNQRVVINAQPDVSGQSIPDAVSDAFKKVNDIPDVNIYHDSAIQPEAMSTIASEIPNSQNVVTEQAPVPGFARAIGMLRECAEEIKKSGYYINVEEMDLDGQYKIIFTIDK